MKSTYLDKQLAKLPKMRQREVHAIANNIIRTNKMYNVPTLENFEYRIVTHTTGLGPMCYTKALILRSSLPHVKALIDRYKMHAPGYYRSIVGVEQVIGNVVVVFIPIKDLKPCR